MPTAAEAAVRRLFSLNYLNDELFARNWALSRAQNQSYGPRKIEQELRSKGVDRSLIHKILRETFAQVDEVGHAKRLLIKYFKAERLDEPKIRRHAAAFLQRRGYSSKVIFDLLRYSIEEDC